MRHFTISVDLHDVKPQHYQELHPEMTKRGFTNTLTSSDGRTVAMPRGHFSFEGDVTKEEVLARVKTALKVLKRTAGIVVTQSAARPWSGLMDVDIERDAGHAKDILP